MSIDKLENVASSQFVFGILFIFFLLWFLKRYSDEKELQRVADEARDKYMMDLHRTREESLQEMMLEARKDSLAREAELTGNMRKMVDQQERIGDTLKEISAGLTDLEKKLDSNVLEIWKVMAQNGAPKQGGTS